MKQVQAVVQSDKLSAVIDAIEKVGVGGITVSHTRGRGKGQRPAIESGRGTGVHIAEFSSLDTLFTVGIKASEYPKSERKLPSRLRISSARGTAIRNL